MARWLITGCSTGIGREIARAALEDGQSVVVTARRAESVSDFADHFGDRAAIVALDVTDKDQITAAVRAADERFGGVDVLVNNAGIIRRADAVDFSEADWDAVMDTNLKALFFTCQAFARAAIPRGRGKIVNIGSLTSDLARPTIAPYAVSKGGIKMLTRAMAAEWGALGIQANAIGPGYMVTDMNQALIENPDFDAWVKARTPMRRWGQPKELVGLAIFLSSDASNFVSGQLIYADGGITAVL